MTSTDFTSGGGGTGLTIPAGDVDYWSGAATATTGDGTFTPGQATALLAVPLDNTTPITAFSHSGGTGRKLGHLEPDADRQRAVERDRRHLQRNGDPFVRLTATRRSVGGRWRCCSSLA